MADQKLSELSAATGASSSDSLYIVQSGVSKRITAAAFASGLGQYAFAGGAIVRYSGSSTVTSAGTSNSTSWFNFDSSLYWGAHITLGARDIDNVSNDAHYIGMFWSTANSDGSVDGADLQTHKSGGNEISIPEPTKIGNGVYFYFQRQSSTTNRIKVAYEAELYLR
jgi:hypothetical protein